MASAGDTGIISLDLKIRELRPLLGEINDLKRIRAAGRSGSLADQGFARAWTMLVAGIDPGFVAMRETASALASIRLGGIDATTLRDAGLEDDSIAAILRTAIREAGPQVDEALTRQIDPVIADLVAHPSQGTNGPLPEFVALLQAQPRAGATRPGFARLVLEPPENHAEHCYITAVYAVLAAPLLGADPGVAFLAGLSHHFHNAYLPDSGFAGEELLGTYLQPIMEQFTARALTQLPAELARSVQAARAVLPSAETAEGQAFHAGDVWDRVIQMEQYARVAAFETRQALVDLDLVHPGPLQAFHHQILTAVGLLP